MTSNTYEEYTTRQFMRLREEDALEQVEARVMNGEDLVSCAYHPSRKVQSAVFRASGLGTSGASRCNPAVIRALFEVDYDLMPLIRSANCPADVLESAAKTAVDWQDREMAEVIYDHRNCPSNRKRLLRVCFKGIDQV